MSPQVLIITHSADLHADLAFPLLNARGGQPFRLNLDRFPCDYEICQRYGDGAMHTTIRHTPSGDTVDLARIGAVWNRKPADFNFDSAGLGAQELAFARQETEQALFGVLYTLDCYWMSHPVALRGAQWKGEQLQRAARLGFRVPASLVTNSPEQVRAFRTSLPGPMIFKAMSTPALCADEVAPHERVAYGLPTTLVTDDMMQELDAVRTVPCHFQQYIAKQYELRVTMVGRQVFAARIHTQDDARTAIDSRDMSAPIRYEATRLPPEIEARCLALMDSYGLTYSAMDLIVTPEGEYVFLENNPAGQFYYVQQLIPQFALLDAVADTLLENRR